jgi:sulfite reductase (NADPH) flavoprotein alpha-component
MPADGALHLLVRRMLRDDGTPGIGSGWLTQGAPEGSEIALRICSNPGFHVPAQQDVPLILIGNGTGLAGLRALLKARAAGGHRRHWLLFGERHAAHDFFHREEIERWRSSGHIERLDLAWSRDAATPVYVQQRLAEAAAELRRWVEQGAAIYVCGSLAGMAPGVDAVLRETLGSEQVEQLRMSGRYRRDVY